jgi:protocatechuate 3,4-dioxygenase beta subunit
MSGGLLSRRELLGVLGAGVAVVAVACKGKSVVSPQASPSSTASTAATSASASPSCVLAPEMTEGPYYLNGEAVRRDITEGKAGTPLRIALTVVGATSCKPLPGAAVDLWHADALGNYSGFGAATSNRTFLRGTQVADADGKVTFDTLYPGWYQGRAVHIHLKVHNGGSVVHTGQLFFDEKATDAVYASAPYNTRTGTRLANSQDSIYGSGGAQSLLAVTPVSGGGYAGAVTLGVRAA